MRPARRTSRGFTLIELMVVVVIIAVMCVISYDWLRRARPRQTFNNVIMELEAMVHAARQSALASGANVVVLVFPLYDHGDGRGRIIVIRDDTHADESVLVSTAALSLKNYAPSTLQYPVHGKYITKLDLPAGVLIGPSNGSGVESFPFPYDGIKTNVDCSFCGTDLGRMGAIVFDPRGRTSFCKLDGGNIVCTQDAGGSLTIYGEDLGTPERYSTSTLMVTCPQGMLRTVQNG